jgi:hypothetical protein
MSFLVAAYVLTVGGVLAYGASVWVRRRAAARQRAAWLEPAGEVDERDGS